MAVCIDFLGPAMQGLLDCAEDALNECGRPVGLAHLAPGTDVAWDNCCEPGGQLWVRAIEAYPTGNPFPTSDTRQACNIDELAVRLGVGVIRCAHTIDDQGNPPTAEEMTADTLDMTADSATLLAAVQCCPVTQGVFEQHIRVERGSPLGPSGGCVGWEWQILLGLAVCREC